MAIGDLGLGIGDFSIPNPKSQNQKIFLSIHF